MKLGRKEGRHAWSAEEWLPRRGTKPPRGVPTRLLIIAAMMGLVPRAASAQTLPEDELFETVSCGGVESTDSPSDAPAANDSRDLVGFFGQPALLTYFDGDFVYLRMRVNEDPRNSDGSEWTSFGWMWAVDTDGDLMTFEFIMTLDGITETVDLQQNTETSTPDDPSDRPEVDIASYDPETHAWATSADSAFDGTPDWFVTIAIPIADLQAAVGTDTLTVLWAGTSTNGDSINADLACHDGSEGKPSLSEIASDPIDLGTFILIEAPMEGAILSDATPTISGTTEPGATVTVTIDGSGPFTATVDEDGNWTLDAPDALGNGMHTATATAMDPDGNTEMDTVTFEVDAPVVDPCIDNPELCIDAGPPPMIDEPGLSGGARCSAITSGTQRSPTALSFLAVGLLALIMRRRSSRNES